MKITMVTECSLQVRICCHVTFIVIDVSVNLHGSSASGYALVDSNVNLSLEIPSNLVSGNIRFCANAAVLK